MNLEELLDELRENVLRDDAELASGPDDRLWSDDTLVRYLNDAQRRFARKTLLLRDSTTPQVVEVLLATGVSAYRLHKSVRAVISARFEESEGNLVRVGNALIREVQPVEEPYFDVNSLSTLTPGIPRAFDTDESFDIPENSSMRLTVYPAPREDENEKKVLLRVARMPINDLDLEYAEDSSPEIPEDYHLVLCEWAAFLSLRNSDIDGHSDRAARHEKRFNDAIEEAMREARRKLNTPIEFRFGRFGFSWER